jgi:2,3-bisphosphoglycerate-dependent phosphoglycerate mutase
MPQDFQQPFALPSGATEVVLIRHGSTGSPGDTAPIDLVDGLSDPELTALGRAQAEAVSERLATGDAAAVFVSPLRRARQTAAPLAARLGQHPVVVPELREVHLGAWEGRLHSAVARDDELTRKVFEAERWDMIPGAEPMEQLSERVRVGINRVADKAGPDRVAFAVVHGGVIAEACRQVTDSRAFAFLYAGNGSITRIMRLRSGRWSLISFNDTAHLQSVNGA